MAKLTLTQFQQQFSEASRRADTSFADRGFFQEFIPGGSLSPEGAIEVYRTGHIARLTEALGETFEAVWWVAGDEYFFELAKEFLLKQGSQSYNLSDLGQFFPDFLVERKPFSDLPFLAELARFEWLFKEVFHASPHTSLSPEDFQTSPLTGNLCLSFGPSVRLFQSQYAVYDVWKIRGTERASLPEEIWDHPEWLLCYKHQQQVFVKALTEPDYRILHALLDGATIEKALVRALEKFSNLTPATVSNIFQLIHHTGIGTAIHADPEL